MSLKWRKFYFVPKKIKCLEIKATISPVIYELQLYSVGVKKIIQVTMSLIMEIGVMFINNTAKLKFLDRWFVFYKIMLW